MPSKMKSSLLGTSCSSCVCTGMFRSNHDSNILLFSADMVVFKISS
jgi:hypothetical protein